jgi:hypothetical protein
MIDDTGWQWAEQLCLSPWPGFGEGTSDAGTSEDLEEGE